MRSDRRPAVCDGVGCSAVYDSLRCFKTVIQTHKGFPVAVKAIDGIVYGVECEVISSFLVFSLVEHGGAFYFHFTGVEVSLEVGGVILCIPQTPFDHGEEFDGLRSIALIFQGQALNFAVVVLRYEERNGSGKVIFLSGDDGIAHTVTAFIGIQLCFCRRPARRPDGAVVVDIEVTTAHVNRNVVVTVSGDSTQTGILKEVVAAGCVGNQREEFLGTQVIDPRIRGSWILNHVFLVCVIKKTKFHM